MRPTSDDADDRHRMAEPARAVGREEHRQRRQRRGHRGDRDCDVQAQLRPAVRVLIEPQSRSTADASTTSVRRRARSPARGTAAAGAMTWYSRNDEDAAGECGRRDELEVAASRVVAVGHAGGGERVQPSEQVRELEADERARRSQSTATSTTSASATPSDRDEPDRCGRRRRSERRHLHGGDAAATRRPGGRRPATRSRRRTGPARAGRRGRSGTRAASSMPRRKIGSADANSTAKISTSGTASTRPRSDGPTQDGHARGVVTRSGVGRRSQPSSAGQDRPRRPRRPISKITLSDRRVTARPENAAIDAAGERGRAGQVQHAARNGSARTATNTDEEHRRRPAARRRADRARARVGERAMRPGAWRRS